MKNFTPKAIVASAAIIGISIIEVFAISRGLDGVVLTASIGSITAIAGFMFGKFKREN